MKAITHTVSLEISRYSTDITNILIFLLHQLQRNILLDMGIQIVGQRQGERMRCTYWRCYREFIIAAAIQVKRIIRMRIMRIVGQLVDFYGGQRIHHIRFVGIANQFELQINKQMLNAGIS